MVDRSTHPREEKDPALLAAEARQRFLFNAAELALSIGDIQKDDDPSIQIARILQFAAERISQIINFDICGLYMVDQTTSDITLCTCLPAGKQNDLERIFEFMIENGYVAWALREQRGVSVYSNDIRYRAFLHVIATQSRIRGLFTGLFPVKARRLPGVSLQGVSLVLRNVANALESLEYMDMYQRQNAELDTRVDKKVDELRRHDLQRLNAQKMDAIAALAGGVAHQYNNALTALSGNLELIRLEGSYSKNLQIYIDRIDGITRRMSGLAHKLLAYTRGGKYHLQTITVNALVANALKELETPIDSATKLELMPPAETYFVNVDVMQMQMAISAIINNSIEAIEKGGRISIRWEKRTAQTPSFERLNEEPAGDHIVLEINDNGRGMDDITKHRIFEPFFSTKFPGRGLSLAAVYGIVTNHHGAISVESEIGKGTTVYIELPLAKK